MSRARSSSAVSRRGLIAAAGAAGIGLSARARADEKLAVLGGQAIRTSPFPGWPVIRMNDETELNGALKSGRWYRMDGARVRRFEETWAAALGANHCLAVNSGTSALITALNALEVGPGDEVIVPPYTFVATINAALLQHALPIFVDSDLETFQIDAGKIEAAATPSTRCLLPVHLGGGAADMDAILALSKRRSLPVIEDACQSHFAEWRGRKLSTLGDMGCFSFQASKNLNSGEGGAILSNRKDLYERCFSFHNQGGVPAGASVRAGIGCNVRMTEFQGAILASQFTRLEEQARVRERNARYLTEQVQAIPGIAPARMYPGCTRNAYHLYMFRYDSRAFAGVPKATFLAALRAEGAPCSGGYSPLNKAASVNNALRSRAFRRIYGPAKLKEWEERTRCPVNDRLCEEAVWLTQNMLLGEKRDMDDIAAAIRKVQRLAATLLSS